MSALGWTRYSHISVVQVLTRIWPMVLQINFLALHYSGLGYLTAHLTTTILCLVGQNKLIYWSATAAGFRSASVHGIIHCAFKHRWYSTEHSFTTKMPPSSSSWSRALPPAARPFLAGAVDLQRDLQREVPDWLVALFLPPQISFPLRPASKSSTLGAEAAAINIIIKSLAQDYDNVVKVHQY